MQKLKTWRVFWPWIAGAALVVLIGFVVASAPSPAKSHAEEAPPPVAAAPPLQAEPDRQQFMQHIRQRARETKGDWSRLDPQDRQLLNGYTAGHGPAMFKMLAAESPSAVSSLSDSQRNEGHK